MINEGKDDLESSWMHEEENFRFMSLSAEGQDPGTFDVPVFRSLGDVKDTTRSIGIFEEAPFGAYNEDFMGGRHKSLDNSWLSSRPFGTSKVSKETPVEARVMAFPQHEECIEDEPPKAPSYIEPNYHFKSTSNPTALFSSIGEVLKAADVDFTVKLVKYKYKCVCYRHFESITFDVRIFSLSNSAKEYVVESAKEYVVEFQRRKGDVMKFASMYHNLKAVLAAKGHVVVEASRSSRPTFEDLPELPEEEPPTTAEYEQTISCLAAMFNSHCVDIQTQAIQALAQLTSGTEDVKRVVFGCGWSILSSAVVQQVGNPGNSTPVKDSEDIHRCAVSGIANLLQDSREVAECAERTPGLIASIVELVSSEVLQVARESARALANLGKQLGRAVTDEFKQNVRKLPQAQDTLTRAYLLDLQSAVGVVV